MVLGGLAKTPGKSTVCLGWKERAWRHGQAFSYGVTLTGHGAMAKVESYSCKLKCYK